MKVLILTALLIFLLSKILIQRFKASIARLFLRFMSFSVSSKLPSNLHFFHFSLPCRIISYASIIDSLITRLRFARVDGVVSLILCYPLFGCGCPTYIICIFRINFEIVFCFSLSEVIMIFAFFG